MDLCGGCNFYDIDIWEYAGEGELGTIEDMSDWLSCFAAFEGDFPAYFSLLLDFISLTSNLLITWLFLLAFRVTCHNV